MAEDIYRKLQKQLDQYSMGFPATDSGIEITILKKIFSEEEAVMFNSLSPMLETPEEIAGRINMPVDDAEKLLEKMAGQGQLFRLMKNDVAKYGAIPFVHGLYEFKVKTIDRELADLIKKYFDEGFNNALSDYSSGFLRTIPIQQSLEIEHKIAPYEDASEILKSAKKIVITDCICRKAAKLVEDECDKPLEVCFMFGSMGQYYLDHDMGREIKIDEALKILTKAQEAGLVTQPASSQNPTGMCSCCGDCCGPLAALNKHPNPSKMVFSNYFAEIDAGLCTGCEICLDRCQMDAIKMNSDSLAEIDLNRCIGCGLCVTTCSTEAIKLTPKPDDEKEVPPENAREQMMKLAKDRGVI